jgi:hypothetical protein
MSAQRLGKMCILSFGLVALPLAAGCGFFKPQTTKIAFGTVGASIGATVTAGGPATDSKDKADKADKAKPDFTLTAEEYLIAFKKDVNAAADKYVGKVIDVSGQVQRVSLPDEIYLKVEKDPVGLLCNTKEKGPWEGVAPGSKVKIRGKLPKGEAVGCLHQCVIIEATESK